MGCVLLEKAAVHPTLMGLLGGGALTGAPSEKAVVLSVRVVVSLGISEQNFLTSVKLSLFNDMGTVNYNINFLICDSNFVPVVDDDII